MDVKNCIYSRRVLQVVAYIICALKYIMIAYTLGVTVMFL